MRITIGVRFLFEKVPNCKAFSILFNDNRLCGCSETSAAELFLVLLIIPFNKRSQGVRFSAKGCTLFNYFSILL